MNSIQVRFPCGDINLEGEWLVPDGKGPFPCVVVCHPSPPNGGDMFNNVVAAVCQALTLQSITAFRFNFRGVGNSEGSYGEGIAEREDVKAALDFALSSADVDSEKVGLAGYSFGGMVALNVAPQDKRVNHLAVIASPVPGANWEQFKAYDKPKLYIIGDADQMCPLEIFRQQLKDIPHPEQYQLMLGADHFFHDYEEEVGRIVSRFFADGFNED